jgi:hypothetical protein
VQIELIRIYLQLAEGEIQNPAQSEIVFHLWAGLRPMHERRLLVCHGLSVLKKRSAKHAKEKKLGNYILLWRF